jgi:hypothetical protein
MAMDIRKRTIIISLPSMAISSSPPPRLPVEVGAGVAVGVEAPTGVSSGVVDGRGRRCVDFVDFSSSRSMGVSS